MKLLVTGGAGFIGSALCRHVVGELGWSAVAVDKLTYAGNLSSLAPVAASRAFHFVQADVCDRDAMDAVLLRHEPDAILHLAAETHVDRSIQAPDAFVQTNVVGTATLLEAARAYYGWIDGQRRDRFRFLHISTDEVFGSLGPLGACDESARVAPRSPYAASKAAADQLVSAWGHTYGLPVLISNCANNYGPYQLCEKLIPLTILNALHEEPLPVYGDGMQVRDWLHVDDHVRALVAILTRGRPGEPYNVGARCERTNLSVVEAICAVVDDKLGSRTRHKLIRFVPDRPGHDRRYAIDPAKLERELGWAPRFDFEAGLRKTVAWYIDHPEWWRPLRSAGHGTVRLGLLGGASSPAVAGGS